MQNLLNKNHFFFFETNKFDSDNLRSYYFFDPIKILSLDNTENLHSFFREIEEFSKEFYLAGFFSYELGYLLEEAFNLSEIDKINSGYPLALICVYEKPVIFNHKLNKFESGNFKMPADTGKYEISNLKLNISEDEYFDKINSIRNYIREGDVYQVNYTIKYLFDFEGSPLSLYNDLKRKQNVSYNVFGKFDDNFIISLSPEIFFHKDGNNITVKPMKGTVGRGRTKHEDAGKASFLANDIKNQSENVMIVDLLRNDIGKISKSGTVNVKKLYEIEKYNTLFQMTSTIRSQLTEETGIYEIIHSIFPSGSITGAPKIRSMEIINELEKDARNVYCGSIGFFEPGGNAKFNVAIRTVLINKNKGEMGIGGGILYDSTPHSEFEECKLKGKFLTQKIIKNFSLIETILFDKNYEHLDLHLKRLKESAEYFDYRFNEEKIILALNELLPKLKNYRFKIRILLDRFGEVTIHENPLTDEWKDMKLKVSSYRTDKNDIFLFHKTTNRGTYNQELEDARNNGFFDSILLNNDGHVTEGTITNLYIKKKDRLFTPPLECGLLNGTIRQTLINKNEVEEKIITLKNIKTADEIFISNAIIGIIKVDEIVF